MPKEFWIALVVLIVFAVFTAAKIYSYIRHSRVQWSQVDKTKLKEWSDDDDWD